MKAFEDLKDYGMEVEEPAAFASQRRWGPDREEVGLKSNGCDLEQTEVSSKGCQSDSEKTPSWKNAFLQKWKQWGEMFNF